MPVSPITALLTARTIGCCLDGSSGLPPELLSEVDQRLLIPMTGSVDQGGGVRSLNLATAVGVVLFEAIRQLEVG